MQSRLILFIAIVASCITSCASQNNGRYSQRQDSAPVVTQSQDELVDATPRYEPYRTLNNRQYTVLGKTYQPLQSGKGFEQEGYESWYGQKFHGHLTSNGEVYDMFAMTAAHKTLPLPSYVKVTNLENNKTTIVRVNDRGPFHDNRIIDLSYLAAQKLDTLSNGVAKVKLEVIYVSEDDKYTVGKGPTQTFAQYIGIDIPHPLKDTITNTNSDINGWFIQVTALSDENKITALSKLLSALYQVPTRVPKANNLFRLQLGPINNKLKTQDLLNELKSNGYPTAYVLNREIKLD